MHRMILIATDRRKSEMIEWIQNRRHDLVDAELFADRLTAMEIASRTGLLVEELPERFGEALGASGKRIEEGLADLVLFLWGPGLPESLAEAACAFLNLAELQDVPVALDTYMADFFLSSLMRGARGTPLPPGVKAW